MRVYIAGPMTGRPEFNYPAFARAEKLLRDCGHDPINPTCGESAPTDQTAKPWEWYMRRSLQQVLDAEGIALLPAWEASRGAILERNVGLSLGLPVEDIGWWTGVTF